MVDLIRKRNAVSSAKLLGPRCKRVNDKFY